MIHKILKKTFGYDHFRPYQEHIIQRILKNQDSIVIMPTGGGKSICYQVPAIAMDGCAIIITPLISLMQDQVMSLQQLGVNARLWNSTSSYEDVQMITKELHDKTLKCLYISPERLAMDSFVERLHPDMLSFFAIDEAHCISEWGHDFRPRYRELKWLKATFKNKPIMALTASATPKVIADIQAQLQLDTAEIFQASFNRKNLYYNVKKKKNTFKQCLQFINQRLDQSGIMYCQSRKTVTTVTEKLNRQGIKALPYHAGLSSEQREKTQKAFIHDEVPIIVATIAFGMGINKPNVRYVIHYDLPKSIENFYQETGRAGRDGLESECVLFFSYADRHKYEYFIREIDSQVEREQAYKKLYLMMDFAAKPRCRRVQLMAYFGEVMEEKECQYCDICKNPPQQIDITVVAQKILSCIYRVNQRFGISMIVDILKGNATDKIKMYRFDQLSTFNIVDDFNKSELHDVVSHLIYCRKINIEGDQYPILKLASSAIPILHGKETITMPIYKQEKGGRRQPKMDKEYTHDEWLYGQLKQKRKEMSKQMNVPAYVILHDKTLKEIAAKKPQTLQALLDISGIGQTKVDRYGDIFLSIVKQTAPTVV